MNVSSLPGLPVAILLSATAIAVSVAGLLAVFASAIASVPGFRPTDDTRNALVRGLCAALNLGALLVFAWSQNVVIPRSALPELVTTVIGMTGVAHFAYVGGKLIVSIVAGPTVANLTPAGAALVSSGGSVPSSVSYTPIPAASASPATSSAPTVDPALLASMQSPTVAPQGASIATTDAPTLVATPVVLANGATPTPAS